MRASCATTLKIEGAVLSARAYLKMMEKGPGFSALMWNFARRQAEGQRVRDHQARCRPRRALSIKISKELAARGFKFVGPTIVYAFMQAVGMVNDHLVTCLCHEACGGKHRGPRFTK